MARHRSSSDAGSLEQLLAAKEIVVTCGSGGVGKTTTAAALARWPPRSSAARSSCSPSTRHAGSPTRSGSRRSATSRRRVPTTRRSRRPASSRAASCGWRCSTPSSRGTTSCAATLPTPRPRDAILANPLYQNITGALRAEPRLHRDGAAVRDPRVGRATTSSSSTRRRRATRSTSSTRPARMAEFFGSRLLRWLTRARTASRLMHRGVEALLPGGRPHPRLAVPPGHRRVLHPLPVDVRRLRRAGQRGRAAAATTGARRSSS